MPAIASASAPVNGVSPVTVSSSSAMMTSGTARITANSPRSGSRTQTGPTLFAASMPSGIDTITQPIAPIQAIEIDRHVSNSACGSFSQFGSANMSVR